MAQSIGALWTQNTEDGREYYKGHIFVDNRKIRIVVFANDKKKEDTHPDYNIVQHIPRSQG